MPHYEIGFYGGKFMPFHKGHLYCIETAARECNLLHVIMFSGGIQQLEIQRTLNFECLTPEYRFSALRRGTSHLTNIKYHTIDVSNCRLPNGDEDWDAETPLVINELGHFDVIYGSEPTYADYFKRAYPWAEYRLLDPNREIVPISATKIRELLTNGKEVEANLWKI